MKIPNKLYLPTYKVMCYNKKGVGMYGVIENSENQSEFYCIDKRTGLVLNNIVCYERMRHTGKRVTQFLEREKAKQELKSKMFSEMKTPNISFGDSTTYFSRYLLDLDLLDFDLFLKQIELKNKGLVEKASNMIREAENISKEKDKNVHKDLIEALLKSYKATPIGRIIPQPVPKYPKVGNGNEIGSEMLNPNMSNKRYKEALSFIDTQNKWIEYFAGRGKSPISKEDEKTIKQAFNDLDKKITEHNNKPIAKPYFSSPTYSMNAEPVYTLEMKGADELNIDYNNITLPK